MIVIFCLRSSLEPLCWPCLITHAVVLRRLAFARGALRRFYLLALAFCLPGSGRIAVLGPRRLLALRHLPVILFAVCEFRAARFHHSGTFRTRRRFLALR